MPSSKGPDDARLSVDYRHDEPRRARLVERLRRLPINERIELFRFLEEMAEHGLDDPADRVTLDSRYEASSMQVGTRRLWIGVAIDQHARPPKPTWLLIVQRKAPGRDALFREATHALDPINPHRQDH
ncbi:hypothetical protein [Rhodovibrio sodomensis]|uniref:hypothetical protein n=1 Tax=Rhodovibrio sodomensis TaxID=1088 RepID=UPI001902CACA|nr:hypothetical protein [Rhodovibrio sodomensis]